MENFCNFELEKTNMRCGYFCDDLRDTYRCKYFEKCVLPIDKQSEALYYAEREAKKDGRELSLREKKEIKESAGKQCLKCNKDFIPTSNRQKYCEKCRKEIQKEQSKIRNREFKRNKHKKIEC
jgi:hypothetical protein